MQNQIARRVRNATRRLEALERDQVPAPPQPLRFRPAALATESVGRNLLSLRNIHVPGWLAVGHLDVSTNERLLVTGPNGAGKSTLLAVLAGSVRPVGELRRRGGLTVGLLAQEPNFDRPDRTVRATYEEALGEERAGCVPLDTLGLLDEQDFDTAVGQLSAGQRRRLALALVVANPPELLLLDEPTNHLSPRLCDELEDALGTSPGAIVIASHDRWLRSRWHDERILLDNGALVEGDGSPSTTE